MKTENDIRLEYKKDTGLNALEFDSTKQKVEIDTDELREFSLYELESGRYVEVECKIDLDEYDLLNSLPYIKWLEEKILK